MKKSTLGYMIAAEATALICLVGAFFTLLTERWTLCLIFTALMFICYTIGWIIYNKIQRQKRISKLRKTKENALLLARIQPIHNGHIYLIKKMVSECNNVYVCIGSANKYKSLRNPFPVELRKKLLEEALEENDLLDKVHIITLPDWSMESSENENVSWGRYLYYNVVSQMQKKYFSIYYSDNPKYIKKWFDSEVGDYINIVHQEREQINYGVSATKVREAILDKDIEYLNNNCPKCIINNFDQLYERLIYINENHLDDFSIE